MILGMNTSRSDNTGKVLRLYYSLEFNQDEFEMAIKGETLKREVSCAEMSGVWEVKFKKYSKAKHKKIIGGEYG